jgi:hypothetical protein
MGSYNFSNVYVDTVPLQTAYQNLVTEALYEYGHNPYSGTIATTGGVVEFKDFPVKTQDDLDRAESIILDRTQKWEHCEAVRFGGFWYFFGWAAS